MDAKLKEDLSALIKLQKKPCVSIYFSTQRGGKENKQNRIRLKKLLRDAGKLLTDKGFRSIEAKQFLHPIESLLDNEEFGQHQSNGLALLLSSQEFRQYFLPFHFKEQVIVGDTFYLKPLFTAFSTDGPFYVLAFSENHLRFFKASSQAITEVSLKGVPQNLIDAMKYNAPERQLQLHTQTPRVPGARAAAIFHGHGVGIDDKKTDLQEYCRQIARGLHSELKQEHAPMILAAVESLQAIYRKVNTYSYLMDEGIPGNPDLLNAATLHDRAWEIAKKQFDQEKNRALAKYHDLEGTARVSSHMEEILQASCQGKVESLFLQPDVEIWGTYDPLKMSYVVHYRANAGDTDLVNLAAIQTFQDGGKVWTLENAPDSPSIFAIYRY